MGEPRETTSRETLEILSSDSWQLTFRAAARPEGADGRRSIPRLIGSFCSAAARIPCAARSVRWPTVSASCSCHTGTGPGTPPCSNALHANSPPTSPSGYPPPNSPFPSQHADRRRSVRRRGDTPHTQPSVPQPRIGRRVGRAHRTTVGRRERLRRPESSTRWRTSRRPVDAYDSPARAESRARRCPRPWRTGRVRESLRVYDQGRDVRGCRRGPRQGERREDSGDVAFVLARTLRAGNRLPAGNAMRRLLRLPRPASGVPCRRHDRHHDLPAQGHPRRLSSRAISGQRPSPRSERYGTPDNAASTSRTFSLSGLPDDVLIDDAISVARRGLAELAAVVDAEPDLRAVR